MVTATGGRLPLPSASTTSSGTSNPVAVLPFVSIVVRNLIADESRSAGTLDEVREAESLEFNRLGSRFADGATEAAYREWHIDEAIPFTRLGMETSVVGWIAATIVLCLTVDGFFADAGPLTFGLVVPLILATLAATFVRRAR